MSITEYCAREPYDAAMSLRMAALGLLMRGPASGYDLLKEFQKSMANVWPATQSQLYSELNKLADAGLIEVSALGARGRKEYRITADGRAELHRWVADPDDDPPLRVAALLRVFLLGVMPPGQAREHLEEAARYADSERARLAELRDSERLTEAAEAHDDAFFALAALDFGLRLRTMQGEWARDVLTKLAAREN